MTEPENAPHTPPRGREGDPPPGSGGRARTHAQLEKLTPKDGDILVLRCINPPTAEEIFNGAPDPYEIIHQWCIDQGVTGVLVVALATGQDISVLTEEDMAEHGWVRKVATGSGSPP